MRFRADISNVSALSGLISSLTPLSKVATLKLKSDVVHLICFSEGQGIQVWSERRNRVARSQTSFSSRWCVFHPSTLVSNSLKSTQSLFSLHRANPIPSSDRPVDFPLRLRRRSRSPKISRLILNSHYHDRLFAMFSLPLPIIPADSMGWGAGICEGHCAIFYVYIGDSKDPGTQGGVLTFFVPSVNLDGDD
ncbi:hypothetical protein P7C70_g3155, partial [Phenoliferia sp. Uapishka_3]